MNKNLGKSATYGAKSIYNELPGMNNSKGFLPGMRVIETIRTLTLLHSTSYHDLLGLFSFEFV